MLREPCFTGISVHDRFYRYVYPERHNTSGSLRVPAPAWVNYDVLLPSIE